MKSLCRPGQDRRQPPLTDEVTLLNITTSSGKPSRASAAKNTPMIIGIVSMTGAR